LAYWKRYTEGHVFGPLPGEVEPLEVAGVAVGRAAPEELGVAVERLHVVVAGGEHPRRELAGHRAAGDRVLAAQVLDVGLDPVAVVAGHAADLDERAQAAGQQAGPADQLGGDRHVVRADERTGIPVNNT
jgi:hypothetical protein